MKKQLLRISPSLLDLQMTHPEIRGAGPVQPCGGDLMVKDWGKGKTITGRYELYCEKCGACDPNGYDTQEEVVTNGSAYFNAQPKQPTIY